MSEEDTEVEVPFTALSNEALVGLAQAFVLREGTDYGERTFTLAEKVDHVLGQLKRGDAVIVFSTISNSTDIVLKREFDGQK